MKSNSHFQPLSRPSLAEQMEDFFQATVLPAYSMTEANPLCSNPRP